MEAGISPNNPKRVIEALKSLEVRDLIYSNKSKKTYAYGIITAAYFDKKEGGENKEKKLEKFEEFWKIFPNSMQSYR